jgi:hypothetical protein
MPITMLEPSAYDRWHRCQTRLWNARALARMLAELSWNLELHDAQDAPLCTTYMQANDLRSFAELLCQQLVEAEAWLSELEGVVQDQ